MAERLIFPPGLRQELLDHARTGDPDEVCGILAGHGTTVEQVYPVGNTADAVGADAGVFRDRNTGAASTGRAAVHYYMDPRDQLRVYNKIDDLGLDVVGYYHSHTHTEARPSPTDIRLASDLSPFYILVSLTHSPSIRAWRISKTDPLDETGELIEIPLADPA
ncbi:MAG TPA: M67 family metallopeptidase [Chloroflexota bacterium]|jgi:proteasome lid subunit RPN8/RPN11|nr:M67 family metallopeptidase [Chloroflexota bacterium]